MSRSTKQDPLLDTLTHLYRRFQDAYVANTHDEAKQDAFTVSVVMSHGHVDDNLCECTDARVWSKWGTFGKMDYVDVINNAGAKTVLSPSVYDELLPCDAQLFIVRPRGPHERDMLVITSSHLCPRP